MTEQSGTDLRRADPPREGGTGLAKNKLGIAGIVFFVVAAAAPLVGRHDFAAFAAAGSSARSTVRTVFSLRVEEGAEPVGGPGRLVHVWVEGDGFLYRMVRNVVGSLVEVGAGRRPPRWVQQVLRGRRRERAAPTAPPEGLTLWLVRY